MKRSIFLVLVFVFQSLITFSQPKGIHISWNGEKNVNTSSTMSITWMNDKQDAGTVQYGTESSYLASKAKGRVKYVNDLKAYVTKVTLHKLKPATYYYYKVGSQKNG